MAGLGVVCRNAEGGIVATATKKVSLSSPEIVEAMAIRFAMQLALRLGFGRVMIESDAINVIKADAFERLKLQTKDLSPVPYSVTGFNDSSPCLDGKITLPVTIGTDRAARNIVAEFLVIDVSSVYNVIMGRPIIHQIQGVVSTYHQLMIYISDKGFAERIRGSQEAARKCNYNSVKSSKDNHEDENGDKKENQKE
ncbi:uncharacterized protein LOC110721375 [Chenopodium quinoa]|uniref:uncharacterized protein LOC110721375 n=1 Tax=Chenopodium quinoa TaxID=63459 RepID=UPI000B789428|nr:uncharacterized protein LOC110721375 [Chenopodium quinoa]